MPTDLLDQPRMDPRFAQRWVEVRRQEGRRRLRALLVALAVVAVTALVIGVFYSPIFGVRHVRVSVTGGGPVSVTEVEGIAGLSGHRLMMDIDGAKIASRLDRYPWLAEAAAQRRWPGTVTIEVVQRQPLAQVEVEGYGASAQAKMWAEVDVTGRVLEVSSKQATGLAVISGPGAGTSSPGTSVPGGSSSGQSPLVAGQDLVAGEWIRGGTGPEAPAVGVDPTVDMTAQSDSPLAPRGVTAELSLLEVMPATLRHSVVSVSAGTGSELDLRVAAGSGGAAVEVLLGDGSQLASKVASLATLEENGDLAGASVVDLSVPARPAVTLS